MLLKKWTIRVVKMSELVPQGDNSRIIDPKALNGLKASIGRFGLVELIVWNERTKHIVGGHQRYSVLMQSGVTEAPVIVVDLSPEDERAASLTLNNPQIEGVFDEPVIELLGQVEAASPDLFRAVRMDELKESLEKMIERNSGDGKEEDGDDGPKEPRWDTECPCCGGKFLISASDIVVIRGGGNL